MHFVLAVLMFVVLIPCAVRAEDTAQAPLIEVPLIEVTGAYAYATVPVQKNGAVFGTFENPGSTDIGIVKAESDVAERIELHTHLQEDGVMMMRQVESFNVPAGGTLNLEPMGDHIMLFGLKAPLVEGETFSVQLFDTNGVSVQVPVSILKPGTKPGDAMEAEKVSEEAAGETTE